MTTFDQYPDHTTDSYSFEDAPPTDTELASRVFDGDNEAFSQLWQRHANYTQGTAYLAGASYHDKEDAMQDAALKLWLKMSNSEMDFSSPNGARDYIGRMTTNALIDAHRKVQGRGDNREQLVYDHETVFEPRPVASAEHEAINNMTRDVLTTAVAALPTDQADLITSVYHEGEPMFEYIERTSIPSGTVKTRARRAATKLRNNPAVAALRPSHDSDAT